MTKLIKRALLIGILVYCTNLLIGGMIELGYMKRAQEGTYYPPLRWEEFYNSPENSMNVLFIGASLCNKGYIPYLFDSLTSAKSFNMGSSIQTTTTTYFVLKEVLSRQPIQVVFLDVFTRTLTYESQIESVRYNFNYMKWNRNKINLYLHGLSFKEQVEFLFPAYSHRDQIPGLIKQLSSSTISTGTRDVYFGKGFIKSIRRISHDKLESLPEINRFDWEITPSTDGHLFFLDKIIDLCAEKKIELILITSPLPGTIYKKIKLAKFEDEIEKLAQVNHLKYINFNQVDLGLVETRDFKDQHLNYWGAQIVSAYVADYYNNHLSGQNSTH